MNRSVDGDIVAVEVFDEKEWKAPTNEVVDQESERSWFTYHSIFLLNLTVTLRNDDVEDSDEEGDPTETIVDERRALKFEERLSKVSEKQPTGRVVGIIKRNWRA